MGKKKINTPRVKRMKREGRLQLAAASWLKTYTGNRPIYGYRKHFGVSNTSWGFAYGITWEEMERLADNESLNRTVPPHNRDAKSFSDDELPVVEDREAKEMPFELEDFIMHYEEC